MRYIPRNRRFIPALTLSARVARCQGMRRVLLVPLMLALTACNIDLFDPFGSGSYDYDVRLPAGYGNSTRQWPVLVFLHGSDGLPTNFIANYAAAADSFPFILVTPHTKYEWEAHRLTNMLDDVRDKYRADRLRVYVTGFSMGAHGAFDWAADDPTRIAAAVMIAGAGRTGSGCRIKTVPSWFIHNRGDPIVPTSETEQTVSELQACNATEVVVTINEDPPYLNTHNAWTAAYATPPLYDWLLLHHR